MLATIVDAIVLGVVYSVLFLPAAVVGGDTGSVVGGLALLVFAVIWFAYYVVMEARWGQTLGKMLLGIMVVQESTGRPPGLGGAALRTQFRPTGWTPVEGALDEAGRAFEGREDQINRVVLVTDGIETCGGDPVAAAERLHSSGVGLQIDVVGFGVPTDQAGRLKDIALAGGGEYFDAETGADLDRYLEEQGRAIEQTEEALRCEVDNATIKGGCDAILCSDGVRNLVTARTDAGYALVDAQADGDQELEARLRAEIDAYDRLIDRIYDGLEERRLARENASAQIDDLGRQLEELREQRARAYDETYGGGSASFPGGREVG